MLDFKWWLMKSRSPMLNITDGADVHPTHDVNCLGRAIILALNRAMNVPAAAAPGTPAWRCHPESICFDLIGAYPLGWSYAGAAGAIIDACEEWFNDNVREAARRRDRLRMIRLMVPRAFTATNTAAANSPNMIKAAWTAALK